MNEKWMVVCETQTTAAYHAFITTIFAVDMHTTSDDNIHFRAAKAADAESLTELTMQSKSHDNLFIAPLLIGKGYGPRLLDHLTGQTI